jgi:23S rRNA pseudouridine2457 synthase
MARLVLFNKPFNVLCQFSANGNSRTLADYIQIPDIYPAGRLDKTSEGLVLLTDSGKLQARISDPKFKLEKTYWVQVEGMISDQALQHLSAGVDLRDGLSRPAKARGIEAPLPARQPAIRHRQNIPTSWVELKIREGKNRQVRRMTAAVGYPTLRLFRHQIGKWCVEGISSGEYVEFAQEGFSFRQ